jgi:hypothetical protein
MGERRKRSQAQRRSRDHRTRSAEHAEAENEPDRRRDRQECAWQGDASEACIFARCVHGRTEHEFGPENRQ